MDPDDEQEYLDFERDELLPQLHDAGHPTAPQVLSGQRDDLSHETEETRLRSQASLRREIQKQLIAYRRGGDLTECVQEIMDAMGETRGSLPIAARVTEAMTRGPQTLMDLACLAAQANGVCLTLASKDEVMRWRKRTLRVLDSIAYRGGVGVYEHKMENGQLCYGLIPPEE